MYSIFTNILYTPSYKRENDSEAERYKKQASVRIKIKSSEDVRLRSEKERENGWLSGVDCIRQVDKKFAGITS